MGVSIFISLNLYMNYYYKYVYTKYLFTCCLDYFRMFVDSCKRIRIMKGSEAIGLG